MYARFGMLQNDSMPFPRACPRTNYSIERLTSSRGMGNPSLAAASPVKTAYAGRRGRRRNPVASACRCTRPLGRESARRPDLSHRPPRRCPRHPDLPPQHLAQAGWRSACWPACLPCASRPLSPARRTSPRRLPRDAKRAMRFHVGHFLALAESMQKPMARTRYAIVDPSVFVAMRSEDMSSFGR